MKTSGNEQITSLDQVRFKVGDFFLYKSKNTPERYYPHILLGQVTDIFLKTTMHSTPLHISHGKVVKQHVGESVRAEIHYRMIYEPTAAILSRSFDLHSNLGEEAVILTQEEIKVMDILYG